MASFSSHSSSSTGFLLTRRRAFTPESSPILSEPSLSPITIRLIENDTQMVDIEELEYEIPETPQTQPSSLSPPPIQRHNPPTTYKERLSIHILRHVAGFTLNTISKILQRPISTIGYIARRPITPIKRPISTIFDTPGRKALVLFIESDAAHRRLTLGELTHEMGYKYLESTLRRALTQENYSRYVAKSQPFISDQNRLCRINYVDAGLPLPLFH